MAERSFSEQFSKGFADAIADIREKLVEEPMYGRALDVPDTAPQWPEARESGPALGSATHERECVPEQDIDR
jgi:hypothetical protein